MTCRKVFPCAILALLSASMAGTTTYAHEAADLTEQTAWSAWHFTPDIVIPVGLVALIYVMGMRRRRTDAVSTPGWRHALFFAGLASVVLALESPVDAIAEHLFLMHQIQHLLLRMLGPMLLALSWPGGLLITGLPAGARRTVVAPVIANRPARRVFGILANPIVATGLYIGSLLFWQIPRYHNLALLSKPVHYLMHVTLFFTGLLFWWRVFDCRRPKSLADIDDDGPGRKGKPGGQATSYGLAYGVRLMLLWVVILSNIVIGAYTTLKSTVLYPAYGVNGRLFGYSALADEQIGGIIIWILSSLMCLMAVLIVIHMWGLHETRMDERRIADSTRNSAALLYPTTGADLIARARPKNRGMAIGFSAFVFSVFVATILSGVLHSPSGAGGIGTAAKDQIAHHATQGPASSMVQ